MNIHDIPLGKVYDADGRVVSYRDLRDAWYIHLYAYLTTTFENSLGYRYARSYDDCGKELTYTPNDHPGVLFTPLIHDSKVYTIPR